MAASDPSSRHPVLVGENGPSGSTPDGLPHVLSRQADGTKLVLEILAWPSGNRSLRVGKGCAQRLYLTREEALILGTALLRAADSLI